MKNAKNDHGKQTSLCKTLTKLLATGLACAAVLIGSPIPAAPVNGSIGNTVYWGMPGDCWEGDTDNGQGIAPQNERDVFKDTNE